jgi:hypothetical protein
MELTGLPNKFLKLACVTGKIIMRHVTIWHLENCIPISHCDLCDKENYPFPTFICYAHVLMLISVDSSTWGLCLSPFSYRMQNGFTRYVIKFAATPDEAAFSNVSFAANQTGDEHSILVKEMKTITSGYKVQYS